MRPLSIKWMFLGLLFVSAVPLAAQNWKLVWADEFETSIGPDWKFVTGDGCPNLCGWGNNELEYYTNGQNAAVVNGVLEITARKEANGSVTSAKMETKGMKSWKYGKMETRVKLPLFHGAFPAVWMLGENIDVVGWPKCGEIDVLENINMDQKTYGTLHWGWDWNTGHFYSTGSTNWNPAEWHTISVVWDPYTIIWYLNNNEYRRIDIRDAGFDSFRENFFLLINLAYRSNWTESAWPGATLENFPSTPQIMYVDYVRVYQLDNTVPTTIEAESYSTMLGVEVEPCSEGGSNVSYIDAKDWMVYNSITFPASGDYKFEFRVASPGGATLSGDFNSGAIQLGSVDIPAKGSWQDWQTVSFVAPVTAGTYNFGLYAKTGGWNINYIKIAEDIHSNIKHEGAVSATELLIFPNPASNELNIQFGNQAGSLLVQIVNMSGISVIQTQIENNSNLDVTILPSGVYALKIMSGNDVFTKLFVKK